MHGRIGLTLVVLAAIALGAVTVTWLVAGSFADISAAGYWGVAAAVAWIVVMTVGALLL